ncbi:hypothetical protein [Pelagibius marinus]|uniref:hypothetical protein n=1 Tax=Pelagibius marinus TaxID=2762760 RepID=UPI001872AFA0|nr:hypothetical protein [Pelagibius marinus]
MDIDEEFFWAAGVTLVFVVIIICISVVLMYVFSRIPNEYGRTLRDVLQRIELLKLSTILIIIVATTYLAILGKLSDGAVALLSGVAGYVLGTVRRSDGGGSSEEADQT